MAIAIRTATPLDAAVVADFNRRMAEETEHKQLDPQILLAGVAALLADGDKGVYYLACDGDDIVGQLMITREWSDWRNGWWWWIQSVYVRANWRRKGVFQALYHHVVQAAQAASDVLGLRLYVEKENTGAQATYRKLGMSPMPYLFFDYWLS